MCISDLAYIVTADKPVLGGFMELFVGTTTDDGGYYSFSSSTQEGEGSTATSSYSASGNDFAVAEATQFSSPMAIEMMLF
ncbi:MAG: hypothetical protein HC860_18380 [Alkalinema sp. RU_4_3]|nr:hypothetical protein [Alkalinema sp. RU_4_3]